jgi:hypothetical protein
MTAARARIGAELAGMGKARLEQLADLLERVRGNDNE